MTKRFFVCCTTHLSTWFNALLPFKRSQKVDLSDSSCLQWFPYALAEGVVDVVKPFTVLGRERGENGEAVLSETLLEVRAVWLSNQ